MPVEKVFVRSVSCLGLDAAELHALKTNKARVILVSSNQCEVGVVIGKEERKPLDRLSEKADGS